MQNLLFRPSQKMWKYCHPSKNMSFLVEFFYLYCPDFVIKKWKKHKISFSIGCVEYLYLSQWHSRNFFYLLKKQALELWKKILLRNVEFHLYQNYIKLIPLLAECQKWWLSSLIQKTSQRFPLFTEIFLHHI